MTPFELICKLQLVDWEAVLYGIEEGYLRLDEVSNYAQDLLSTIENDDSNFYLVSLIASSHDWTEIQGLVKNINKTKTRKQYESVASKKWQLSFLKILDESSLLTDQEKIEKLQHYYSKFFYPDIMQQCSIYLQDNIDPLEALKKVIKQLEKELNVNKSLLTTKRNS